MSLLTLSILFSLLLIKRYIDRGIEPIEAIVPIIEKNPFTEGFNYLEVVVFKIIANS